MQSLVIRASGGIRPSNCVGISWYLSVETFHWYRQELVSLIHQVLQETIQPDPPSAVTYRPTPAAHPV